MKRPGQAPAAVVTLASRLVKGFAAAGTKGRLDQANLLHAGIAEHEVRSALQPGLTCKAANRETDLLDSLKKSCSENITHFIQNIDTYTDKC